MMIMIISFVFILSFPCPAPVHASAQWRVGSEVVLLDESEPGNGRGSEAGVTDRGCSGSMMSRMRSNTCKDDQGRDSDRHAVGGASLLASG